MTRAAVALLTASAVVAGLALGLALAPTTDARAPRPAGQGVPPLVRLAPVPVIPARSPMGWEPEPDPAPGASPRATVEPEASPVPATVARRHPLTEPKPVARAAAQPAQGGLRGTASWFAAPDGTAAAGPALRAALGPRWRGSTVTVSAGGRAVRVRLTDWCQCYRGTARERLVDLSATAFARLAPLSRGVLDVTVSAVR